MAWMRPSPLLSWVSWVGGGGGEERYDNLAVYSVNNKGDINLGIGSSQGRYISIIL